MKTRAALALSITGILVTGSAALAVNTQTLGGSQPDTFGDAHKVLLPGDSATGGTPSSSPASTPSGVSSPDPGPATSLPPGPGSTGGALPPAPSPDDHGTLGSAQPGPGTPPPVDDKGGTAKAPEPGDDSGGHGGRSGGSDD